MRKEKDYNLIVPTWCKGCGIYGLFAAFKKAAVTVDLDPEQLVVVTGIGCHGRFNNYLKCYGFHALHGRTLPVAAGVKLANPGLDVVAISGDGDAYSIGLNHFLHTIRRNMDVTYIVVNNQVYALTQGQTSPTSQVGYVSISTPLGSRECPLDGLKLALAAGATFVARGFSGEPAHLASLIERGLKHKGFSLIEVLSPCVTHNKINTYQWYREHMTRPDQNAGYNARDKRMAWKKLINKREFPVGLIYEEEKATYETLILGEIKRPLIHEDLSIDVNALNKILKEFD